MLTQAFLQQVILAIFIGALLGMEREYHKHQEIVCLRTFALVSLLGAVSVMLSGDVLFGQNVSLVGLVFVSLFALALYINGLARQKGKGFTTNIALIIAYIFGVMVGHGLMVEAVFLSVVVAIILFSREKLHNIVGDLNQKEVGDLLEFLVLLGIVYPIIPETITFYGVTLPLLTIWLLVVLVSVINFVAFISARFLSGSYQVELISFFGGLINSRAATLTLSSLYRERPKRLPLILAGFFTLSAALVLKCFVLVAAGAPEIVPFTLLPFVFMGASFVAFAYSVMRHLMHAKHKLKPIRVESPFNVGLALKLGGGVLVLFLVLELAGLLGLGAFLITSFVGGMLSSTATCISLGGLVSSGVVDPVTGAFSLFLTAAGALVSNWVMCYIAGVRELIAASAKQMFLVVLITMFILFITVGLVVF